MQLQFLFTAGRALTLLLTPSPLFVTIITVGTIIALDLSEEHLALDR